jgi:hypothetical protein
LVARRPSSAAFGRTSRSRRKRLTRATAPQTTETCSPGKRSATGGNRCRIQSAALRCLTGLLPRRQLETCSPGSAAPPGETGAEYNLPPSGALPMLLPRRRLETCSPVSAAPPGETGAEYNLPPSGADSDIPGRGVNAYLYMDTSRYASHFCILCNGVSCVRISGLLRYRRIRAMMLSAHLFPFGLAALLRRSLRAGRDDRCRSYLLLITLL